MIKIFRCKFCNSLGSRKFVRKCIMTHIKTDKKNRLSIKESRKNSNISNSMIRREFT
jgi:hypothetical protein